MEALVIGIEAFPVRNYSNGVCSQDNGANINPFP